jgi:hypothetical protein
LESLDGQVDSGAGRPETEELLAIEGRHQKVEIGVDAVSLDEIKVVKLWLNQRLDYDNGKKPQAKNSHKQNFVPLSGNSSCVIGCVFSRFVFLSHQDNL